MFNAVLLNGQFITIHLKGIEIINAFMFQAGLQLVCFYSGIKEKDKKSNDNICRSLLYYINCSQLDDRQEHNTEDGVFKGSRPSKVTWTKI